jgi:CcmD family protein
MTDLESLYIAYTIIWAGLLGYMAYLHFRQTRLAKDLSLLEEMVKKDE